MEQQLVEINHFNNDINVKNSKILHNEWGTTINQGIRIFNDVFNRTHFHMKFRVWNFITYLIMRSKYNNFQILANKIVNDARKM